MAVQSIVSRIQVFWNVWLCLVSISWHFGWL